MDMNHWFDIIMVPVQVVIFLFTVYYFLIGFNGLWRRREAKVAEARKTFAVLVCAHNEQNVIGNLLDNLRALDYPDALYDICVIADNCTDATVAISRAHGVSVLERHNDTLKGKGFALQWGLEQLFARERQYDAVCVFDADNLVDARFLREMNNRLCKGDKVIQGYLDAKNPCDTWVSGTFAIAFWVMDHIWHLAKTNIGLSSVLGGTGMCITTDVLKLHGWNATCLTEDMEFTMKALLEGVKTTWAHDAIVYDEKPLTFMQSWRQRQRWAQGQFDVAHRLIPVMLREGVRRRDIKLIDATMHLMQPHFLLLSTAFFIVGYAQILLPPFYTNIYAFMPSELLTAIMLGQYILPVIIMAKIRAPLKTWLYLLLYPVFIYSWIPIVAAGWLHRNEHEWSHTLHTRALTMEQLKT